MADAKISQSGEATVKISPQTLPNVTVSRQNLPEELATAPRNQKAEAVKADPSSVRANPPVFSTLSPETNWSLVEATQREPSSSEHAGKSTAHAARALIEERPDLAGLPFGKVVSMLARGLTPPAGSTPPAADETTTPPEPEVVADVALPPLDAQAPEIVEGGDPAPPPAAPVGEQAADGTTQAALALLDALNESAEQAPAPAEPDPNDLFDLT